MPRTDRVKIQAWHLNGLNERVFDWQEVQVSFALHKGEKKGQCIECNEPVKIFRMGRNGEAAHPEHYNRNPSCGLSDVTDDKRPETYKAGMK